MRVGRPASDIPSRVAAPPTSVSVAGTAMVTKLVRPNRVRLRVRSGVGVRILRRSGLRSGSENTVDSYGVARLRPLGVEAAAPGSTRRRRRHSLRRPPRLRSPRCATCDRSTRSPSALWRIALVRLRCVPALSPGVESTVAGGVVRSSGRTSPGDGGTEFFAVWLGTRPRRRPGQRDNRGVSLRSRTVPAPRDDGASPRASRSAAEAKCRRPRVAAAMIDGRFTPRS